MKLPLTKLNAKCHSGRQMLTQKRYSVGRDAKAGLEELIVRLVNRGLAKRHGESVGNHMRGVNGRNVTILQECGNSHGSTEQDTKGDG